MEEKSCFSRWKQNVRSLFNSVISDLGRRVHSEVSTIKDASEMLNRDKPS